MTEIQNKVLSILRNGGYLRTTSYSGAVPIFVFDRSGALVMHAHGRTIRSLLDRELLKWQNGKIVIA